jgi:divalent metal cation (Fe/Co/Zn/Cd) transporter
MTFIPLGFGLLLILVILTRRVALIWRLLGVALIVGTASILIMAATVTVRAGEVEWYQQVPYKQLIALVVMIAGMAAKYFFDLIEARRRRKSAGDSRARLRFDRWDFAQPFLVSLIVFGSFWSGHGDDVLSLNWLIMSFQNGFFWQTLLGKQASEPAA